MNAGTNEGEVIYDDSRVITRISSILIFINHVLFLDY